MICKTTKEFQNKVLEYMTFTPHPMGHYTIYKNKEKPAERARGSCLPLFLPTNLKTTNLKLRLQR